MPNNSRKPWSRDELLLALHLYWRIPFGHQHSRHPRVIELAEILERSASSVAMKLNNLTSLDPDELARGVRGLPGASMLDRKIWDEFQSDQAEISAEAEEAWHSRVELNITNNPQKHSTNYQTSQQPPERIETTALRRIRLGQSFFRRAVLDNFEGRCALTGLAHPDLINASHIVGWAEDEKYRVDAKNGIALNRLHDAAFDKKLITFDEQLRLIVGRILRCAIGKDELAKSFLAYEGQALRKGIRHDLNPDLLERHRAAFAQLNE